MARYDETESRWLLPAFMRSDAFDDAMAGVIDEFGAAASASARALGTWDRVGQMGDAEVDALADELNIPWYDRTAPLDAKRAVVKGCKRLQAKLGTKWALEEILGMYFTGGAVITEWFDYEEGPGEPGHFRVEAECFSGTGEESGRFLSVLGKVKRSSAVLDRVIAAVNAGCDPGPRCWMQGRRVEHMAARRDS